ncbi:MAG: Rid family detoxifying hydrolase [Candidatus Kariarchaeaceae archaeon]
MKEIIHTNEAPAAIGPYSQGVKLGNLLFTAGQIALDPSTKQLVKGSIEAEVDRIMQNLAAIAKAANSSLEEVVKTTIFVTDLSLFSRINEKYGSYFSNQPPARSTVEVSGLPAGANVEIEMIIAIPS